MTKRTWNPKKKKRIRKHGFMKRMSSLGGIKVIKRRRVKGRSLLAIKGKKK
jgi:large subunit ribosomal protein L34